MYLLESPRRGNSNKHTNVYLKKKKKKTCLKYPSLVLKIGPIKFLYNSKFDFTANSLVTSIVVITRVLCILVIEIGLCSIKPRYFYDK